MSHETLSSRGGTGDDFIDSQQTYQTFIMMDELMDKLKILNYDDEFIKGLKMRPLSRQAYCFICSLNISKPK